MSDVKDIDDADNPELNEDAIKDKESEAKIASENNTDPKGNNEKFQDDAPENLDKIEEDIEAEDESEETRAKSEDKNKLSNILKWTGIVSLPLIATALLLFLKPSIISNLFNTTELQVFTPKTAAIQWTAEELEMINVVGQTLTETEKIWNTIFTRKGGFYKQPDFTIFTGRIRSTCVDKQKNELTIGQSSLGTFYCPAEKRIYIDLSLHLDLKNRLDIPGDFADRKSVV